MGNAERSLERRIVRLERWNRLLGAALHGPESRCAAVLYLEGEGSLRLFDATGTVTERRRRRPGRGDGGDDRNGP